MLKELFLLFSVIIFVNAGSCPSDICDEIKCDKLSCNKPNQYVQKNGDYCGCCDLCVTEKSKGEFCSDPYDMEGPPREVCEKGLSCSQELTCE